MHYELANDQSDCASTMGEVYITPHFVARSCGYFILPWRNHQYQASAGLQNGNNVQKYASLRHGSPKEIAFGYAACS